MRFVVLPKRRRRRVEGRGKEGGERSGGEGGGDDGGGRSVGMGAHCSKRGREIGR